MDLENMTRKEMQAECKRLGIKGVVDKDKPTIRQSLEDFLAAEADAKVLAEQNGTKPVEPPAPVVSGEPLTGAQRTKLRGASNEQIEAVLTDPKLSVIWRDEFQKELNERRRVEAVDVDRASRTSVIQKYLIKKGGPFALAGRMTQLRTGGVISALTHDLFAVRAQGIEIEPLKGKVVISHNEMGVPTTVIVDAPKPRETMTGDAPIPGD